jgi:dTMP kinase
MMKKKRDVWKGFFVLEGMDGAGTTTQLRRCENEAKNVNLRLSSEAEPTNGAIGTLLRRFLRHELSATAPTLAWLFAADRQEHLWGENGVREKLDKGSKVLSDRYFFSSLVYQGLDLDTNFVSDLQKNFPFPEAVFFLDIDVETALKRRQNRGQGEELFEALALQERIRQGYLKVFDQAKKEGTSMEIHVLDARLPIEELQAVIWERICR